MSRIRQKRIDRERFVESLFSPANLERKTVEAFSAGDLSDGRAVLSELDSMLAVVSTDLSCRDFDSGAKLRALYLSGGDLNALRRAVQMAMRDHRDLHQESELPGPGWPGVTAAVATDGRSGFDRFIDWLAE